MFHGKGSRQNLWFSLEMIGWLLRVEGRTVKCVKRAVRLRGGETSTLLHVCLEKGLILLVIYAVLSQCTCVEAIVYASVIHAKMIFSS